MQDFQTIAHLIPNFGDKVDDPPATIEDQGALQNIFFDLLGQSADFIQPVLFRSGRLVVYAQAAVWAQHIQHRRDQLFLRCQAEKLMVTEIKVKVLPDLAVSAQQNEPRVTTYNVEKASQHLDQLANQLGDSSLKETLSRLANRMRENHQQDE